MRNPWGAFVVATVCALTAPAFAQEFGEYDAESYPKQLTKRPLLLAASMFEVRFGGASNFVADADTDRFNSKIDFSYGLGTRFQVGAESDLAAFPTDEFAVGELGVFAEYSLVPTISGRFGGFMIAPRDPVADDLSAKFGVRATLPMKFLLGKSMALFANSSFALLDGDSYVELPIGLQLQAFSALAFIVDTGIETRNFEFTDNDTEDTWNMPFGVGASLSFTRKIDFTLAFRFTDVANDTDDRWLLAFFSFRG
jgi:hypothetical protein